MKIGIVTNLYPPYQRGGAEFVVVRTVEALLDQGHDVFVITGRPRKAKNQIEFDHNTEERIYRFFPRNLYFVTDDYRIPWIIRLFWHFLDAVTTHGKRRVKQILKSERPDVVITHNLKGIGLRIPQAIQRLNIPHVHVMHDIQLIYPSGLLFAGKERIPWYREPFYRLYRLVCKWAFRKPDLVLFPSRYVKSQYQAHTFFLGVPMEVMPNPAPKFPKKTRSGRSAGPLRVLFVGQLERHKGIRFLLNAFEQLPFDAQLIIAGEGSLREEVKERAKANKHVSYLGYISTSQLLSCFGVVDVMVVPSLCYENSPTVIYEALQSGIPVVASDIGGVGELIMDEKNGRLFATCSTEDFIAKMSWMNDKKEWFARSQDDIRRTIAPYAIELYTGKLVNKLEEVIERRRIS